MSTYRKEGKDVIIFATADDHKEPSKVKLPEPEPQAGLILPNGEINWNCPCLGGMATGPCGLEFREAFSCFHNSEADPKGSDCYDAFKEMHLCMAEYPKLYNKYDEDDEEQIDIKLTDAEKALISEDKPEEKIHESNTKEKTEKEKVSLPKVEEKSSVHKERKDTSKPAAPSGRLEVNA